MIRALVVVALLLAAAPAAADRALPPPVPEPSKKDARWAEKQAARKPLRKLDRKKLVGKPAAAVISIFNTWTHEWVAADAKAKALPKALTDRLLRCHFTNEPADMDNRLSGAVLAAARHFGATRVHIVSGFRAPKYNLMLRKKGRQVARDSQHTHGNAIDFYIPRIATMTLHTWAKEQEAGGVGLYLESGFVHMDTGNVRYWAGD